MILEPIGLIHSPYSEKSQCPIQPLYAPEAIGRVEVFEPFAAGLKDIETFSHLYLIYHFDRAEGELELVRATFLDDEPHGIFASRHPCRPNGIGISIVKLLSRIGNNLEVEGIDVLDQTPLTGYQTLHRTVRQHRKGSGRMGYPKILAAETPGKRMMGVQ